MTDSLEQPRIHVPARRGSPLLPIFLTVFVDVLGLTMMLPLLPLYGKHFGASDLVVTCLGASYAACQFFAGPVLGRLSDRVGRKPVLLVSQMGTFAAFLIIGGAHSLWWLFAGRMLDGLTAGNLGIAQAYISDVTRPENRTRAFGVIGISFGVGFLIGPGVSGLLADRYGFGVPAYLAAAMSLLSIVLTAVFVPNQVELEQLKAMHGGALQAGGPPPPTGRRSLNFGKFFTRPLTRLRLLQFFAYTTSFAVLQGGLALFLHQRFDFGVDKVGYVFMLSGFMGVLIQGPLGRMVKWLGEARLALFGFITMAVGYPLLGYNHALWALIALVCFAGFGVTVVRPCVTTLITKSVGRHEQGEALGASQSLASISQVVGQPLAGLLIGHRLLGAYGLAAGLFALAGALLSAQPEPAADGAVGST
jgi:DHA1 family tetracycline resistance protein-like MFS transporter